MITTTEILKAHAPEFVALDEVEKEAELGPWRPRGCSGRMITRSDGYYGNGFLADVDLLTNTQLICESRNKIRALLDAYAQTLVKLERAKQTLAFYAPNKNKVWHEDCGIRAQICLDEIGKVV